jgi:hypothetical protein
MSILIEQLDRLSEAFVRTAANVRVPSIVLKNAPLQQ